MSRRSSSVVVRSALFLLLLAGTTLATGCGETDGNEASSDATVFEGAMLILGDGSEPVADGVIVVEGDQFTAVGPRENIDIPRGAERVDLSGKTVMPAIVNAHIHLSSDRAERTSQLQHMAYYGTGAALSLGLDEGTVGFEMRDEIVPDGARSQTAGRGITSPEPGRSEVPHWVTTQDEARAAVRELADADVDFVKIWVDARGGQYERLSQPLYSAIIDEAHQHGLRVTAHVFTLEDAKGLLRAGIDAFAHGVRDLDTDDELLELWAARPEVILVPNLPGPGVATDLAWLSGTVPTDELQEMQAAQADRPAAQAAFGIQSRNLLRFRDAGVTIAFGTDGSSPWAAHQEMEDMVRSGMSPAEVIVAATKTSAELMKMEDVGTVAVGMSADFIVMDANPLEDITNSRRIHAVYLRGTMVDRNALAAQFLGVSN